MSMPSETGIRFRILHDSPIVQIKEYRCPICQGAPGPEEGADSDALVLLRRGSFCRHFGRKRVVSDVNQAAFFGKGSTYRVSHPGEGQDRGTVLSVPRRILNEFIKEWDPSSDDQPDRAFLFPSIRCTSEVYWRHRELLRVLNAPLERVQEPFRIDVTALQLFADILGAGFDRQRLPRSRRKAGTVLDHEELIEAGKVYFADHLGERLTLDEVARALHTSPFHFARIFQQGTGIPIHRYLTLLRLRTSLEPLADGQRDLAALALALGFSSHSHFTDAFRKEFKMAPSEVRPKISVRQLGQLSKNPEAWG
jgi:AraC-like DNA-binding protein